MASTKKNQQPLYSKRLKKGSPPRSALHCQLLLLPHVLQDPYLSG